ncbi:MAG: hypothetical protein IPJ00_18595 [Saprospirales bacterium]|nr:hypothetical protein [Saprospirales bacterium]
MEIKTNEKDSPPLFLHCLFFLPEMRSQVCSGLNFQILSKILPIAATCHSAYCTTSWTLPISVCSPKEGGLRVLDISDPEDPQAPRDRGVRTGRAPRDEPLPGGNYLYLALGNHFGTAARAPAWPVDVSIPASPMLLDVWISPGPEGGAGIVLVEGDYAYLGAMGNGLFILDVSNPNEIEFISDFVPDIFYPDPNPDSAKFNARGMALRDQIVYLCYDAGGLRIINVSDKENPKETGRYANPALNGLPARTTISRWRRAGLHSRRLLRNGGARHLGHERYYPARLVESMELPDQPPQLVFQPRPCQRNFPTIPAAN